MGLFTAIFGNKPVNKVSVSVNEPVAGPSVNAPDFLFYEQVVDKIAVSEALKADLKTKLKQAFDDPQSFYDEAHEFILADRGLTYPSDRLKTPKFVLVDTLDAQNQMAEIDWKSDEGEIRFAINRILKGKKYTPLLSDENAYEDAEETGTFELLNAIDGSELKPSGYALEILDIDSDSYVFTIIPLADRDEVSSMFTRLK